MGVDIFLHIEYVFIMNIIYKKNHSFLNGFLSSLVRRHLEQFAKRL